MNKTQLPEDGYVGIIFHGVDPRVHKFVELPNEKMTTYYKICFYNTCIKNSGFLPSLAGWRSQFSYRGNKQGKNSPAEINSSDREKKSLVAVK